MTRTPSSRLRSRRHLMQLFACRDWRRFIWADDGRRACCRGPRPLPSAFSPLRDSHLTNTGRSQSIAPRAIVRFATRRAFASSLHAACRRPTLRDKAEEANNDGHRTAACPCRRHGIGGDVVSRSAGAGHLSGPADPARHRLHAGRSDRHRRAAAGAAADGDPRPAGRDRQQAGRRRQHRVADRGRRQARRLHAAGRHLDHGHRAGALRQAALRPDQGPGGGGPFHDRAR